MYSHVVVSFSFEQQILEIVADFQLDHPFVMPVMFLIVCTILYNIHK